MHRFPRPLLLTTLLLSTSSAAPAPLQEENTQGSFKAYRIRRDDGGPNIEGLVDSILAKYSNAGGSVVVAQDKVAAGGTPASADPTCSPMPTAGGSHGHGVGGVGATPGYQNSEFLSEVFVGGMKMNLNLDTGSSDLWIYNTKVQASGPSSHSIYEPSKSPTHIAIDGATFNATYGDGSSGAGLTGDMAVDSVVIGGVSVSNQAIQLPTSLPTDITKDPNSDGIVGLAFQKLNKICTKGAGCPPPGSTTVCPQGYGPNPHPTWFENAKSALSAGLFTVNFLKGTSGYFSFGEIDHSVYKGELAYHPIDTSAGYWQFPSTSYKVGDNGNLNTNNGNAAIADTGTSLLVLDDIVVANYYKEVSGWKIDSQGYTFPCGVHLPNLVIALGSYMATISGELINYAKASEPGYCFGGIQSNKGNPLQVFGDILFKSQFAVFDYDNLQIGFAEYA